MNSSMALWYRKLDGARPEHKPTVELHLNLWRQTADEIDDSNFLDVGLLLKDVDEVENVFLFVPIDVLPVDVEDLSIRLRRGNLLSAVFNDVMSLTDETEDGIYTTSGKRTDALTIHPVRIGSDVVIEKIEIDERESGMLLRFRSAFVARMRGRARNYLRIRFLLDRAAARQFTLNTRGRGHAIVSTILSEEFTEVRFNELRSVPAGILSRIERGDQFVMTGAHCFLIRDRSFELVDAHAPIHKMRRMEARLWNGYIPEKLVKTDLSKMLIYHWKSSDSPVESFVTLAHYKRQRDSLIWYMTGVVVLGAIGSTLAAMITETERAGVKIGNRTTMLWLLGALAVLALLPKAWTLTKQAAFWVRRKWIRWHAKRGGADNW